MVALFTSCTSPVGGSSPPGRANGDSASQETSTKPGDYDINPEAVEFPEAVQIGVPFGVTGPRCGTNALLTIYTEARETVFDSERFDVPIDGWNFTVTVKQEATELELWFVCDHEDRATVSIQEKIEVLVSGDASTTVPPVLSTPVPPTINSSDFHLSEKAVPLPQLVGLNESTARQWAGDSGFSSVRLSTERIPLALIASERIVLTVSDGVVTHAVAG